MIFFEKGLAVGEAPGRRLVIHPPSRARHNSCRAEPIEAVPGVTR